MKKSSLYLEIKKFNDNSRFLLLLFEKKGEFWASCTIKKNKTKKLLEFEKFHETKKEKKVVFLRSF